MTEVVSLAERRAARGLTVSGPIEYGQPFADRLSKREGLRQEWVEAARMARKLFKSDALIVDYLARRYVEMTGFLYGDECAARAAEKRFRWLLQTFSQVPQLSRRHSLAEGVGSGLIDEIAAAGIESIFGISTRGLTELGL